MEGEAYPGSSLRHRRGAYGRGLDPATQEAGGEIHGILGRSAEDGDNLTPTPHAIEAHLSEPCTKSLSPSKKAFSSLRMHAYMTKSRQIPRKSRMGERGCVDKAPCVIDQVIPEQGRSGKKTTEAREGLAQGPHADINPRIEAQKLAQPRSPVPIEPR